jgi:hypothetical protein
MTQLMRRILGTATFLLAAALLPAAQAAVYKITFDDPGLAGLYFPYDQFTEAGFLMTVDYDFGTIDFAQGLDPVAPSGNSTQFYFNSNEGGLVIARANGDPFDLLGFSAAFVPQSPASAIDSVIVAAGYDIYSNFVGVAWLFPAASGGIYPFGTYDDPADFADFHDMAFVEFYACSLVGGQVCTSDLRNNGQFAIDDIVASAAAAVPEPASIALVLVALVALGASRSRKSRLLQP